jgi:hypothetical protein
MLRDSLIAQESGSYLLNLSARSPHIRCLIQKANPKEPMQSSHIVGLCAVSIGLSIVATSPASAVNEQCRSIKSDKERLACFDREASSTQRGNTEARPTTDQKAVGAFVDPVEWLRAENDKVTARLKGVCRGC